LCSKNLANKYIVGEIAGFSARIASHYNNESWAPFIIQGTLLLIGPLFFAATVYMMLGQLIVAADAASVSRIRPVWYTRLFVGADVSTLVVQGLGTYSLAILSRWKEQ
jgi:hypothetical protein